MDVFEAAYRVAHDYKGGAVALAGRLGKNPGTLLNKLNPHHETCVLSLSDAVAISVVTGDRRILEAFAAVLDCAVIALPDHETTSDAALLDLLLHKDSELGDFASALSDAIADGKVTAAEFSAMEREGLQAVAALLTLLSRLKGMVR